MKKKKTQRRRKRFSFASFLPSAESSGDQQLLSTTDYLQIERMGYSADLWAHFAYSIAKLGDDPSSSSREEK